MEIGYPCLQQVLDANVVELLKNPEVNLMYILNSIGQLAGFYPGYDIVGKGMDNSDFCCKSVNLRVRRQVIKSLPYFCVKPFPEVSYSFRFTIGK